MLLQLFVAVYSAAAENFATSQTVPVMQSWVPPILMIVKRDYRIGGCIRSLPENAAPMAC
jgi:hypothetical protein